MTDPLYKDEAIIRGVSYSTRNGYRASFELDPEGWEALKGMETQRCMMVLVPIGNDQTPEEKPRRRFSEMSRAQQAGLLCNDPRFQEFMEAESAEECSMRVRYKCDVNSRSDIDAVPYASKAWGVLVAEYDAWRGKQAAPR